MTTVVVLGAGLAAGPVDADEAPAPVVTDVCGAGLLDQVRLDEPLATPLPEPVVESLDICASWVVPVLDEQRRLAAVEFRTEVRGDLADRPPASYFTWDWFDEDGSCYYQAVVAEPEAGEARAYLRDSCAETPFRPLVDFVVWYATEPRLATLPADGISYDGGTVTLRLDLADAPQAARRVLAPGRVLSRPHTHAGVLHRHGEPYLFELEHASTGARDVHLP
ncbi:MAG TPA: hypothetical protein VNU66_10285 [Mycobacteriales bacterium]|nr:hypothetical protein [Mycobacteriales bacterium]